MFLVTRALFHRASHAADEVTLEEEKDENYRHDGNKHRRRQLVVLGRELDRKSVV